MCIPSVCARALGISVAAGSLLSSAEAAGCMTLCKFTETCNVSQAWKWRTIHTYMQYVEGNACLLCTVPTGSSNSFWRINRCGFGMPGFSILSKVATVTLCLSGCAEVGNLCWMINDCQLKHPGWLWGYTSTYNPYTFWCCHTSSVEVRKRCH